MKEKDPSLANLDPEDRIDKSSYVPAYAQVANILKQKISQGVYQPGARLPSEAAIANQFSISAMTARQAIGNLAEEGLIDRVQGRGTFVKRLQFISSSFGLESLGTILAAKEDISIHIIDASLQPARDDVVTRLELGPGKSVIQVKRLISHKKQPFIYQVSYALADPASPFVETMLESNVITNFFLDRDISSFKKAEFKLLPAALEPAEAKLLSQPDGASVFKLEHVYFDFNDSPAACGWFLISPAKMPLVCRMGVWNHD